MFFNISRRDKKFYNSQWKKLLSQLLSLENKPLIWWALVFMGMNKGSMMKQQFFPRLCNLGKIVSYVKKHYEHKNWDLYRAYYSLLVSKLSYGSVKLPAKFISVQVCSETIVRGNNMVIIQYVLGGVGNSFNFPLLLVMDFCNFTFLCYWSQQSQALTRNSLTCRNFPFPLGRSTNL